MSKYQPEDDDVDEFLYGSGKEELATNNDRTVGTDQSGSDAKDAKSESKQEDDEELYQLYKGSAANETQDVGTRQDMEVDDAEIRQDSTEFQEDEDSDDDLEIILEPEEPEQRLQSTEATSSPATGEKGNGSTLVNLKPGQQAKAAAASSAGAQGTSAGNVAGGTANQNPAMGGINLEAVGEYNGQPITEVDLDSFEDKPWRKPGADITDYFNYGFNEVTWRAYCTQQKMMRESKKMMGDMNMNMNDFMAMSMMMPPGAMMDGNMPMGMPGMPNPMMGMPPMGMPPGMGMGNSPNAQRTGAGRAQPNSNARSGQSPMQQGRSPAGNVNNNNDDQDGNAPMNNPFFWPQMQPPFFPG